MQSGDADVLWPERFTIISSLPSEQRDWPHEIVRDRAISWNHERVVVWQLREPGPVFPVRPIPLSYSASPAPDSLAAQTIVIARDGKRLVNVPLRVLDTEGRECFALDFSSGVRGAAFSENGKWLAICNLVAIYLYNCDTGTIVQRFGQHDDEEGDTYCALAVTDDGSIVVSGSLAGGRSFIWDTRTGERLHKVGGIQVAIDAIGQFVVAGHHARAWVVSTADGRTLTELPSGIMGVSTPPKRDLWGEQFASRVAAFDFGRFASYVTALAISPAANLTAIGTTEWTLLCSLPSGEPLCAWEISAALLTFAPDDRTLGIIDKTGKIEAVVLPDIEALLELAKNSIVRTLTPDEQASFNFDDP
jgi:WD40 repeat protein